MTSDIVSYSTGSGIKRGSNENIDYANADRSNFAAILLTFPAISNACGGWYILTVADDRIRLLFIVYKIL